MTTHSRVASALLTHGTGKETYTHRKTDQSKTKVELYVQYKGLEATISSTGKSHLSLTSIGRHSVVI